MSRIVIAIAFLIIFPGKDAFSQLPTHSAQDTCVSYLNGYSDYWKKDSLGENGFRYLMGAIIRDYNLAGLEWENISQYLGKPNHKFFLGGKWKYRYHLNFVTGPDLPGRNIGQYFLDIEVGHSGLITDFYVWVIDG